MSELYDPKQVGKQQEDLGLPLNSDAHSGRVPVDQGGERPVEQHAHPLREDILEPPSTPGVLVEIQEPKKSRLPKYIGTALVAGSALVAGLLLGRGGDDNEVRAEQTEASVPQATNTPTSLTPATTPETASPTIDALTVVRANGEEVSIPFISDEDIQSGRAAAIIKDVAGLYITTGDTDLFGDFVDPVASANAVESWERIRVEMDMAIETANFPATAIQFDTRDMITEVIEVTQNTAIIQVTGGTDLYIGDAPVWDGFEFTDRGRIEARHEASETMLAHFEWQGDRWRFIGYEVV